MERKNGMMKMTRKVICRVMWLARGTATTMGLALMLAVVLGVATTANAAGDPFKLGKTNAVNKITRLVGGANSAMLSIVNDSTGSSATALDLRVKPGKAPMKVSSGAGKATNLNADRLDGKDSAAFARADTPTYVSINGAATGPPPFDPSASNQASCDDGDRILTAPFMMFVLPYFVGVALVRRGSRAGAAIEREGTVAADVTLSR